MEWWHLVLAFSLNLPVGYITYHRRSLTYPGGMITAGTVGLLLYLTQPLYWVLLLVFFFSSTMLTRYKQSDLVKQEAMSLAEKGGTRDSFQVLANSGIPLVLTMIGIISSSTLPNPDLQVWYAVGLAVSFAVVNADTWATELGVTSPNDPRWILNPFRTVPRGSSGGISGRGLLASLMAATLIALVYGMGLLLRSQFSLLLILLIILGGCLGSLLDSFLGATVQAQYYCSSCDKLTEQSFHERCQTTTSHDRGFAWFSNDLVNFVSVGLTLLIMLPFLR